MPRHSHPTRAIDGPVRLDRLVRSCLGKAVARQGFGSAEILTAWPDIVGPALAGRTRPERIRWPRRAREGADPAPATLVLRAEGGDALEIQHMASEILARLNGYLGWAAVGKLVVRQAPLALSGEGGAGPPTPARRGSEDVPDFDGIRDSGLREALGRLVRARGGGTDNST